METSKIPKDKPEAEGNMSAKQEFLVREHLDYIQDCASEILRRVAIIESSFTTTRGMPIEWYIEKVEKMVKDHYSIGSKNLKEKTNKRNIVEFRQLVYVICATLFDKDNPHGFEHIPLTKMAAYYSQGHCTAIYAIETTANKMRVIKYSKEKESLINIIVNCILFFYPFNTISSTITVHDAEELAHRELERLIERYDDSEKEPDKN